MAEQGRRLPPVPTSPPDADDEYGGYKRPQVLTRQDDFGDFVLKIVLALAIVGLTVMVSLRAYHSSSSSSSSSGSSSSSPQRGAHAEGVRTREASVQCDPIAVRNIACQSQCTYTAVRKVVAPRFQPLPENSHGSWSG